MFQYILISISLESTYWKLDGVPGENGTQWLILRCTLLKLTTDSLAVKQNIKSLAKKKSAIPQATLSNYSTPEHTRLKIFLRR